MKNYWITCTYCGAPVECERHKYGGRTRKKYCNRKCADKMQALRKEINTQIQEMIEGERYND